MNSQILLIVFGAIFLWANAIEYAPYDYNKQTDSNYWNGVCQTGSNQSPIYINSDLLSVNSSSGLTIFNFTKQKNQTLENNGHSIQSDGHFFSWTAPDSNEQMQEYDVLQFHFHYHSEHAVGGTQAVDQLEVHFVSQNRNSASKGVIGILFEVGTKENEFLKPLINCTSLINNPQTECEYEIDFKSDFKKAFDTLNNPDMLQYYGSLTTPPCTEGIQWHVISAKMEATTEQITAIANCFKGTLFLNQLQGNNRNIQALNSRVVRKYGKVDIGSQKLNYFTSLMLILLFSISIFF